VHAKIVLFGLEEALADDLCQALQAQGHTVLSAFDTPAGCAATIARSAADLVFCGTDAPLYKGMLEALNERDTPIPVVVVSRFPETGDWLDAMDAGAADYCAAPFEPRLIERVIENTLKYRCLLPVVG
jgi:DNA-binding NtrC family response regulator